MRILVITNLYPNPYQPQRATYNRQHFRALAQDHEVKVVAPISWVDELRFRRQAGDKSPGKSPGNHRWQHDGIEVVHPRYYYSPGVLRALYGHFLLMSIRSRVLAIARTFRPHILLGSWAYPDGYATVRLARELRIPAAVQVLGSDVNLLDRYPARGRQTWHTLRSADAVICVSQDLANKVVTHGVEPGRVSVVYGGVDRDVFYPGSQSDAQSELKIFDANPMLLFVGNLVAVKAVDILIAACARLATQFPRMQCHIVGDGPLRQALQVQAANLSLAAQIRFHGVIEHHHLPQWYRAADLVVLSSLAEGIPNVLLESIACGRPYVASNTGGIPEISTHGGCALVPRGDSQALAEAIASMLLNRRTPGPANLPAADWNESGRALGQVLEDCRRRGAGG